MSHVVRASGLSIKMILTGVFGAVALLLVASSGWSLWTGWQNYRIAAHIQDVSAVDKLVFQAMQALRDDRSGLHRAMLSEDPIDADGLKDLDKAYKNAATKLADALTAIASGDLPDRDQWLAKLQQDAAKYENLYKQGLASLGRYVAERSMDLRKEYYGFAADFVDELGGASARFRSVHPSGRSGHRSLAGGAHGLSWIVRDQEFYVSAARSKTR